MAKNLDEVPAFTEFTATATCVILKEIMASGPMTTAEIRQKFIGHHYSHQSSPTKFSSEVISDALQWMKDQAMVKTQFGKITVAPEDREEIQDFIATQEKEDANKPLPPQPESPTLTSRETEAAHAIIKALLGRGSQSRTDLTVPLTSSSFHKTSADKYNSTELENALKKLVLDGLVEEKLAIQGDGRRYEITDSTRENAQRFLEDSTTQKKLAAIKAIEISVAGLFPPSDPKYQEIMALVQLHANLEKESEKS